MKKFKKNKGILFWITGLPGSGKTSIAKEIFPYVKKSKNVVGKNLKAEFPKTSDIILKNNFKNSIKKLSKELIGKI